MAWISPFKSQKIKHFKFDINKGSKITSDKNSENVEVKDQIEKMHEVNKIYLFQNSGNDISTFHSDTYSDKPSKVTITVPKQEIKYTGNIDSGLQLDSSTLDVLYNYFLNEYNRILLVENNNDLRPIKGYSGENGTGRLFFTYSFLNKEILKESLIKYNTGSMNFTEWKAEKLQSSFSANVLLPELGVFS